MILLLIITIIAASRTSFSALMSARTLKLKPFTLKESPLLKAKILYSKNKVLY